MKHLIIRVTVIKIDNQQNVEDCVPLCIVDNISKYVQKNNLIEHTDIFLFEDTYFKVYDIFNNIIDENSLKIYITKK